MDMLSLGKSSPVTKEDLGRSTWTFLHTLAAQYPDNPTRQQKKDVKELDTITFWFLRMECDADTGHITSSSSFR
ncbi:hypothetical protein TSUD_364480 [Trifolium subterraneum]|uniref:Sulfhydryl oxidase n=1 Tax=Trifolium subterraneum TaxID=3900 RepID=A0A2Z6N076_TRISU|nr:hypothetical protein TSUD_364480 [Trifolium subterraneum]